MRKFVLLLLAFSSAFGFFRWGANLSVICGTNITSLTFGADSNATSGYDPYIDIPYFTVPGGGYGYFPLSDPLNPAYTMLSCDYRSPAGEMFWDFNLSSGVNFVLKWSALPDSGEFSIGAFVLDSLPTLFVESWQDMRSTDSIAIMLIGGRIRVEGAPVSPVAEGDLPQAQHIRAFPNPFNSSVNIQAAAGEVAIYDISGRLVEILHIGEGRVADWSPSENCNSGVYFACPAEGLGAPLKLIYLK